MSAGQADVVALDMVELKVWSSVVGEIYTGTHQKASPEKLLKIERGSPSRHCSDSSSWRSV